MSIALFKRFKRHGLGLCGGCGRKECRCKRRHKQSKTTADAILDFYYKFSHLSTSRWRKNDFNLILGRSPKKPG